MRKSFVTDKSMVISIPVESYNNVWPEQFHCLFKDAFKVFVHHGRPTALGAAQVTSGIFLLLLSLLFGDSHTVYVFPAVLYMVTGLLSLASGHAPNMPVAKLSLLLNIISVLSSVAAVCLGIFASGPRVSKEHHSVVALIWSLLVLEDLMALYLIYWISNAVCKQHFNVLPVVLLKRGD